MSEPEIGAGRVRRDDLANFGQRIVDALHIPGKHITRLSLVVEGPHFLPVLTVERVILAKDELDQLRTAFEQYKLVPAEGLQALLSQGEAVIPKAAYRAEAERSPS